MDQINEHSDSDLLVTSTSQQLNIEPSEQRERELQLTC